jgi:hypothetical protein
MPPLFLPFNGHISPKQNHSSIERLGQARAKVRQSEGKKKRKDNGCAKMRQFSR